MAQHLEVLARRGVTQEMIEHMDRDSSGQIEKLEFVIHVLQDMGRVRGAGIGQRACRPVNGVTVPCFPPGNRG